jgi:hypothetical protein
MHSSEKGINATPLSSMQLRQSLLADDWGLVTTTRPALQIFNKIRRKLQVPFFMELIILMSWSIFNNIDPSILRCKDKFVQEFNLLLHRVRPDKAATMNVWLQSL